MKTPHVLLLAYYFPPLGLSGVQRTSKFVKYLPEFGWDVTVLTVRPGGYFAFDEQLLEELDRPGIRLVRTGSLDPTRMFGSGKTVRAPSETKRSRWSAISQSVFLPDNKIGWYPAAVRAGRRILEQHPADILLSSAPPYTSHLIAKRLAKQHHVPLVIDFRDDWLGNPRHVYPTAVHRSIHARMERSVIEASAAVVTINDHIAQDLKDRHPNAEAKIGVIPQGFDSDDYQREATEEANRSDDYPRDATEGANRSDGDHDEATEEAPHPDDLFTLIYSGVFYDAQQPDTFLAGLARLLDRRPELRTQVRAEFVGLLSERHHATIRRLGLEGIAVHRGYVSHQQAMRKVQNAAVAWLTVGRQEGGEQISTGKLYAYMGARLPILGLVPEGAARRALDDYGAAHCVAPDDVEATEKAIESLFDAWRKGSMPTPHEDMVSRHDRKHLTGDLSVLLRRVLEERGVPM